MSATRWTAASSGFSTQCSIDPLRYLVGLSVTNRTYELAMRASTLVVHVLHDTPSDRALASWFGEHTARDTDKFRPVRLDDPGPTVFPCSPAATGSAVPSSYAATTRATTSRS